MNQLYAIQLQPIQLLWLQKITYSEVIIISTNKHLIVEYYLCFMD